MGLIVKRFFKINRHSKLELDKKGVGINFGNHSLKEAIDTFNITDYYNHNSISNLKNKIELILEEKDKDKLLEEFDSYLDEIVSIHKNCNKTLNWNTIENMKAPFEDPLNGPNKIKAKQEYDDFVPTFKEKIFKVLGKRRKKLLYNKIQEAEILDTNIYENYLNLKTFAKSIVEGNIDSYFMLIDELMPFNKLLEYGSELEFGTNDKNSIEVELTVNSKDVIPNYLLDINDNKIEEKEMERTIYYDLVQDYVCSATVKIAKETMNLLPVNKVVVHAVDELIDYDTKKNNDITILSIVFDRETLDKLNLKAVDASHVMDNFICNMRHQSTFGFKSVERIKQY